MFFYGYRCCMNKHGTTDGIPNIPFDDEDKVVLGKGAGQGHSWAIGEDSIAADNDAQDTP